MVENVVKMCENKGVNGVKKLVSAVFAIAAALFALFFSLLVFFAAAKGGNASVFGYSFSIVLSPSMEPEIMTGELIVVKAADITEVKIGENVVFTSVIVGMSGERVVHKAESIGEDEKGIFIVTKGVNNQSVDVDLVRENNFIGKEVFHSLLLGNAIAFLERYKKIFIVGVILAAAALAVKSASDVVRATRRR